MLEEYNEQIDYLLALVALLMPIYLASKIYVMIKTGNYSFVNILVLIACTSMLVGVYLYANPSQRLIALGFLSVVLIITLVLIVSNKLIRPNKN